MSYYLFLDDQRTLTDCRYYAGDESDYDKQTWKIVRTFQEFVNQITEGGIPKTVSFDYDLGFEYDGIDCAKYLKSECLKQGIPVPDYLVHSTWPGIKQKFDEILT